jgi:DNA helicase HerA-like ATPase
MGGKAFIIVGGTGMGKTTFTKKCLEKVNPKARLVYDVNNEYRELINYPLMKFDEFCNLTTRTKNAFIVYEEATIFLNNRSSNSLLIDILVRKRHTNNTIFLVFHSLRSVPRYIFDLCNYCVLHKTNDNENLVENRFENETLTKSFLAIRKTPMLWAENGKQYSPHLIVNLN